jgi:hypothetical protein
MKNICATYLCTYTHRAEWCIGNVVDLHSGSILFEPRLRHRLSWLRFFVVFCSPCRKNAVVIPFLGQGRSLPSPFQFIKHHHSTLYSLGNGSFAKWIAERHLYIYIYIDKIYMHVLGVRSWIEEVIDFLMRTIFASGGKASAKEFTLFSRILLLINFQRSVFLKNKKQHKSLGLPCALSLECRWVRSGRRWNAVGSLSLIRVP